MSRQTLRAAVEHAVTHHMIVTMADARQFGWPVRTLENALRDGFLTPVHPGVMTLPGATLTPQGRARAAVAYVGGNAVAARHTAARLWELPLKTGDRRSHVLNDVRSGPAPASIVLHRTRRLLSKHLTTVDGVPCTSIERTIFDLAQEPFVRWWHVRRLTSEGLRRGACTIQSLAAALDDLPRFAGRAMVAGVLDELSDLEPATRSELESLFLRVTTAAGIPPSAMNHPVADSNRVTRHLDAVWLPERVTVELDSAQWHRLATDQHDDRNRANALLLAGWRSPLRFTWWDLKERAAIVCEQIERALAKARAGALP